MGFLTVGQASRGDGGFVRQLLETVGSMARAQRDEEAGGFLLPKREVSSASLTPNRSAFPCMPRLSTPWEALSLLISALSPSGQLWAATQGHPRAGGPINLLSSIFVVVTFCC